jgi:hypothetical protein
MTGTTEERFWDNPERDPNPGAADVLTPAKTTRTVPLEFEDTETGERFDVVRLETWPRCS